MQLVPGVALLVVTSCPGGCFSNWLCQLVNGDLAMSVAMTGCSTLVGLLMLPLNIYIYTRLVFAKEVLTWQQWCGVIFSVVTVFAALAIGLTLSRFLDCPRWRQRFSILGTVCGLLLFLFSVFESSHPSTATTPIWRKSASFYMSVLLPVLMATAIIMVLTSVEYFRLDPSERVAVVIETVYQNTALGATMALQMFPGKRAGDAVGLVVLYQIFQGVILVVFGICAHYSSWTLVSPREMPLWAALCGNFQDRAGSGRSLQPAAGKNASSRPINGHGDARTLLEQVPSKPRGSGAPGLAGSSSRDAQV